MGVEDRCGDVLVAEKLLDGPDVVAVFEEMGREGMAKAVAGRSLGERRGARGVADRGLKDGLVEVVAAQLAAARLAMVMRGRNDPLPEHPVTSFRALMASRPIRCGK